MNTPAAGRCPLCGQPNQCALAGEQPAATPCWCAQITITPAVLARIPPDQRGRACLCPSCATGARPASAGPTARHDAG